MLINTILTRYIEKVLHRLNKKCRVKHMHTISTQKKKGAHARMRARVCVYILK